MSDALQGRVVMHVATVPESLGFIAGRMAAFRQAGLRVVAVSSPGPGLELFSRKFGVEVVGVLMPRAISPLRDLFALRAMVGVIRRVRPDIVHAHTPKGGLLGMVAAWIGRVPLRIYHLRGLPYSTATGWRRSLLTLTERVSCTLATIVVCIGPSVRAQAIADALADPDKLTVHENGGNGIDAVGRFAPTFRDRSRKKLRESLGIPQQTQIVGFVGRLVRDKGVLDLEAAWQRLRVRFPSAHLVVAGPLETRDAVPAEILEVLMSDERVHFLGSVDDIVPVLSAFDVLAFPSLREGLPNVPLEAAALEIPVVATAIPGNMDAVVDGVTGTLVPVGNGEALASALARYLSSPDLRRSHGEAAREFVLEHFDPVRISAALLDEYRRLLADYAQSS